MSGHTYTHTYIHTHDNYYNLRCACAPRVNYTQYNINRRTIHNLCMCGITRGVDVAVCIILYV